MATKAAAPQGAELEIVRVIDAPRDVVWKAWTEVERLARWWGPKGFAMLSTKLDLRPGGMFHTACARRTATRCGVASSTARSSRRRG